MLRALPPEKASILIIDDEPQIVTALTDLLGDDYDVVPETSANIALARVRKDKCISAILCDQRMPDMTGDEFFSAAREFGAATRILITGYADLEAVVRAINEGKIYGYVTKPWDPDALKNTVKHAVDYFELKRMLWRERSLFADLMRSISDGVFFKDAAGRYIRLNESEAAILNLAKMEDAIGKTLSDLFPGDIARQWDEEERAMFKGGGRTLNTIRNILAENGKKKWYAVNVAAIRSSGDENEGLVGISRDVTEEKNIQQMKDEFISTISHELRTPLTSIQGSLALLRGGLLGELPDEAAKMIDIGHQNCGRLLRLINDILDVEKLEKGELHIERRPIDIAEIIRDAADANKGYAQPDGKTIRVIEPVPSALVNADRDRIMQVLANLISNALKFSPVGAEVRLKAAVMDEAIRVSVVDRGCGVKKEFRKRIFQRFSQADSSSTRNRGGAGLGLTSVDRL
jgi:two-component system cell cycle sensor histidine kinase PleC